ncbi:MAG: 4Fe-4S binding protein [Solidesulfovibrio sp.]
MALVPFANARGLDWISGNYLALDVLGLPLGDPLAALQVLTSAKSIPGRAALGAILALVLALILGPVFCAYACPYGLLSELIHALARRTSRISASQPNKAARHGFRSKAAVTGLGLTALAIFGLPPLLNLLSMPAYYSRLWQHVVLGGVLLPLAAMPIVLLAEWHFRTRLWCRFVCPQSVLLHVMRRLSPWALRLEFNAKRCSCGKGESRCVAACSLELDPRRVKELALTCTNCGDCRTACQDMGQALGFRLGETRKSSGTADSKPEKTDSTRAFEQL